MSGTLSVLSRRLAKLERTLADRRWRAKTRNRVCNCQDETTAHPWHPQEFEKEMNLPCPAHGFRRLGKITRFILFNEDGTVKPHPQLDPLIASYLARLDQANRDLAYDAQES